jgi:hypothetical protein
VPVSVHPRQHPTEWPDGLRLQAGTAYLTETARISVFRSSELTNLCHVGVIPTGRGVPADAAPLDLRQGATSTAMEQNHGALLPLVLSS